MFNPIATTGIMGTQERSHPYRIQLILTFEERSLASSILQSGSVAKAYFSTIPLLLKTPWPNTRSYLSSPIDGHPEHEAVAASFINPTSLEKALDGVTVIFGVKHLWSILQDPENMADKKPGQDNGHCFEAEITQRKNLARVLAKITSLEKDVFSSCRVHGGSE
ncbi:hypothetical protein BDW66DRAFT_136917 [Aspergillus desertorum]